VTDNCRKNSFIRNDGIKQLSRIYTKRPKRFTTEMSYSKSNSITRIETNFREEEEETNQNDINYLHKGLTSLFRRQVNSIDKLME